MNIKFCAIPLLTLLSGFFLQGCETTQSSKSREVEVSPPAQSEFVKNYLALEKGMSAEAIRTMFGEPEEVEALVVEGLESSIWRYSELLESKVRMTTKGVYEEFYFDIFANTMKTREVAIEGTERREAKAVIELAVYEGMLVSWKDKIVRSRREY